jgi:hypothetical protein
VTSEQLRLRAGKVRCGHCQVVFNAFNAMVGDAHEPLVDANIPESPVVPAPALLEDAGHVPVETIDAEEPVAERAKGQWLDAVDVSRIEPSASDSSDAVGSSPVAGTPTGLPIDTETVLIQTPLEEPLAESPEESTQAARQAGLVAARELSDTPSFNRWSAGALASDGLGGFESDTNKRAVWPFILVAILLTIGLLGQLLYHFRTDIVLRYPSAVGLYELAAVDIPLPRNSALVSIESSDLQFDNARGMFVLQATLKNRAGHAQAWPALELSLTDTNDAVVSRRVVFAADYLPPGTTSDAFPANGDLAVKLWVEAKESGASGYRLYIFYP